MYGCSDRMCGADDCTTCHPGYKPPRKCDNCPEESYELTTVFEGEDLCEVCLDNYTQCDWCGEWHKGEDVAEKESGDNVCDECEEDYEKEE